MADFVIFDTDVLIDAGRGVQEAVTCLKQVEEQSDLAASVVTQMELNITATPGGRLRPKHHVFGIQTTSECIK